MVGIKGMLDLLNKLEARKIYYKLDKVRAEAIMVEVAVPGQRWEIEFMDDGTVEIEKYISDRNYYGAQELRLCLVGLAINILM